MQRPDFPFSLWTAIIAAMGRFYETTFYDEGKMVVGWHVLASPATIGQDQMNYELIVSNLNSEEVPLADRNRLTDLVGLIGDTAMIWQGENIERLLTGQLHSEVEPERLEALMEFKTFAVEASPLDAKSVYDVINLSDSCHLVVIDAMPALVFLGKNLGIVIISGISFLGAGLGKSICPNPLILTNRIRGFGHGWRFLYSFCCLYGNIYAILISTYGRSP